jgi:hypothetical protein
LVSQEPNFPRLVLTQQIASHECCDETMPSNGRSLRDMNALLDITMKLMQKYSKDNGSGRAYDMKRWPGPLAARPSTSWPRFR